MTIPLERLRDFEPQLPGQGEVTLVVARHQAASWPSPEVTQYAHERARLIHALVDETGVDVLSWGDTDSAQPREIVELLIAIGSASISAVATILAAWITANRKDKGTRGEAPATPPDTDAPLAGFALRRTDGAVLRATYQDNPGVDEIQRLAAEFLSGS